MARIVALCVSKEKGTVKTEAHEVNVVKNHGFEGDAHAGVWHRQVSLLAKESIESVRSKGLCVKYGDFGENVVTEGLALKDLPVGTLLRSGDVLLEVTQIGKACHSHCEIHKRIGDCIMPREGIFARVLSGGALRDGDEISIEEREGKRPYQAAVITLSDKGARGGREDISGPIIEKALIGRGYEVVERILLPDDRAMLASELRRLSDQRQLDLVLTTGGTGFSPRDTTPEATLDVADRLAPGIAEAIRLESMKITKRAMLSRAVSAIRKKTLIINLPGSPKAVREAMDVFLDTIPHGLDVLRGEGNECGGK